MKEALLYEKTDNKHVHCFLCSHHCRIKEGDFGFCGVRQNRGGTLYSLVYGKLISANVDPIEKKPLYHFLPGSKSFSIATPGCNFRCGFCQNWEISQSNPRDGLTVHEGEEVSPQEVVEAAVRTGCKSISFTYTEPTIYFEYALDVARLAKARGLATVFVTNGYMTEETLRSIHPHLDAANVDLKFFTDSGYRKACGAHLEPVMQSIRLMRSLGIWVEVTTLVIPGENDSMRELGGIAQFLVSVDPSIPWHLSRFHPDYKYLDHPATPESTLKEAMEQGTMFGLAYVYVGNVHGWGNDTHCHRCGKLLIRRELFSVMESRIKEGACDSCRAAIPGVW